MLLHTVHTKHVSSVSKNQHDDGSNAANVLFLTVHFCMHASRHVFSALFRWPEI